MLSDRFLEDLASRPGVPASSRAALLASRRRPTAPRERPRGAARAAGEVETYDCGHQESLPGMLVPGAQDSPDPVVRLGADLSAQLKVFVREVLGRDSLDDHGLPYRCCTHYSTSFCNAFWNGDCAAFGDGDGLIFKPFTTADDFIGHEFAHALTQFTAGLGDADEPGALNESVSDVFGSVFRQWRARQSPAQADWRIAADMMGPTAIQLGWDCLRNLLEPDAASSMTKQPARYSQYVPGGEPHVNSGIPNRAFAWVARDLGLPAWEVAGPVWYGALASGEVHAATTFSEFAAATVRAARRLFPAQARVAAAVAAGWTAVEVVVPTPPA